MNWILDALETKTGKRIYQIFSDLVNLLGATPRIPAVDLVDLVNQKKIYQIRVRYLLC
jgi:hypothetical protein